MGVAILSYRKLLWNCLVHVLRNSTAIQFYLGVLKTAPSNHVEVTMSHFHSTMVKASRSWDSTRQHQCFWYIHWRRSRRTSANTTSQQKAQINFQNFPPQSVERFILWSGWNIISSLYINCQLVSLYTNPHSEVQMAIVGLLVDLKSCLQRFTKTSLTQRMHLHSSVIVGDSWRTTFNKNPIFHSLITLKIKSFNLLMDTQSFRGYLKRWNQQEAKSPTVVQHVETALRQIRGDQSKGRGRARYQLISHCQLLTLKTQQQLLRYHLLPIHYNDLHPTRTEQWRSLTSNYKSLIIINNLSGQRRCHKIRTKTSRLWICGVCQKPPSWCAVDVANQFEFNTTSHGAQYGKVILWAPHARWCMTHHRPHLVTV